MFEYSEKITEILAKKQLLQKPINYYPLHCCKEYILTNLFCKVLVLYV